LKEKPPSDEGGGFAEGEDGGRETSLPQSKMDDDASIFASPLVRGGLLRKKEKSISSR
jgi:hypothetical protein